MFGVVKKDKGAKRMSTRIKALKRNEEVLRKALNNESDFTQKSRIRKALKEVTDKLCMRYELIKKRGF